MANIGAAADMTGPELYGYFSSKLDLMRALRDRAVRALVVTGDRALGRAQSADEAFELARATSCPISARARRACVFSGPGQGHQWNPRAPRVWLALNVPRQPRDLAEAILANGSSRG